MRTKEWFVLNKGRIYPKICKQCGINFESLCMGRIFCIPCGKERKLKSHKISCHKWLIKNRERLRSIRALQAKNRYYRDRLAYLEKQRAYRKLPYVKEKAKIYSRLARQRRPEVFNTIGANRRARVRNAKGNFTHQQWELKKKYYGNKCRICGILERDTQMVRDHIIPLSRGGTNFIANLQPLCQHCNSVKYNKKMEELTTH